MLLKLENQDSATAPHSGKGLESKFSVLSGGKLSWRSLCYCALDLCFLIALSGFLCFFRLDSVSLYIPDEVFEVQASLEMMHGERWWLPTHHGEPWLHKPPLKMWLTWPAIKLFNSPNFAFRFVDALCGVSLTLILYGFALALFQLRIPALFSALAFLGCDIMVRYHGFRSANQDSVLLLFSTIALIAGYQIIRLRFVRQRLRWFEGQWMAALIGGIALGAAILTKSAAGLIALIICGSYCLCSGRFFEILERSWREILLVVIVATGVSLSYFLPVCFAVEGACGEYFTENIYGRILKGYHNVEGPWFYLERIFVEGGAVPPALLVFSLGVALFCWLKHRDERYGYLLFWAAIPVACFSISKIKLSWYIASSLCGMALLIGGMIAWAMKQSRPMKNAVLTLSLLLIGMHLGGSVLSVMKPKTRIALDHLAENIKRFHGGDVPNVAVLGASRLAMREMPYALFLDAEFFLPEQKEEVLEKVKAGELDYVFVRSTIEKEVFAEIRPTHIAPLPAYSNRYTWFSAFAYTGDSAPYGFQILEHYLNFGSGTVDVVRDFGPPDAMNKESIRWTSGASPEFMLPGNRFLEAAGARLSLHFAFHRGQTPDWIEVDVLVNGQKIDSLAPTAGRFETHVFELPAGIIHEGDNSVSLRLSWKSGRPVEDYERLLIFKWATLELPQGGSVL